MWLFVGACFGLGYGITQRLLRVNVSGAWQGNQLFGVKAFPGTSLDSLRQRYGNAAMEIRGDLDLLELERVKKVEAEEMARREAELKRRELEEAEQRQRQEEQVRLEQIQRDSPPAAESPASAPIESPLLSPPSFSPEPTPPPAAPDAPQP
jgi:hypothetical protein